MFRVLCARLLQGHQTKPFPIPETALSDRYLGRPVLSDACWTDAEFAAVREQCPTAAIDGKPERVTLDLGRCLFCGQCRQATDKIRFTRDYHLAAKNRNDLVLNAEDNLDCAAAALSEAMQKLFGRSLRLRQVSAGGCNACEADVNVLNTLAWDLGRFGIQFVASPRHADGLLVTGPVTRNMRDALLKTYEAIAAPKLVIAAGTCAVSGGLYRDHQETCGGVDAVLPVNLYIPGCPPHPATTLDGLLRMLGQLE